MTREDLRNLTAQLVVYTALEEVSRSMGDDPVFRHFHDPALERLDTLRADLAALTQPGESEVAVHPASDHDREGQAVQGPLPHRPRRGAHE